LPKKKVVTQKKLKKIRVPPADKDEKLNRKNTILQSSIKKNRDQTISPKKRYHELQLEREGSPNQVSFKLDEIRNIELYPMRHNKKENSSPLKLK